MSSYRPVTKTTLQRFVGVMGFFLFAFPLFAADVLYVLSKDSGPYRAFLESSIKTVNDSSRKKPSYEVILADEFSKSRVGNKTEVIVTVGTKATNVVVESGISSRVMATLIPSSVFYAIKKSHTINSNVSGIFIDSPVSRKINLIRELQPAWKNVAVLVGKDNEILQQKIREYTKNSSVKIHYEIVSDSDEVVPALNHLLPNNDVLLTFADPVVLNSATIQGVLLSAYMKKVPVISYSRAYVKAGALAAVFSSPADVGKHAGEKLIEYFNEGFSDFHHADYPKYFQIEINSRVAHSLGIYDVDEQIVYRNMLDKERTK